MLVSASPTASPRRIGPLDTFRCLTVTLALLSHALLEFRVSDVMAPDAWLAVRSVTRSATPGLLLLFGVMAEVVHYRRYRADGLAMLTRLGRRMAQCYAAFVGLSALVMAMRPEPPAYLLRSLAFGTLEGYTVIFALYFLLLGALALVLPLRHRGGFGALAGVGVAVWALDAGVVSRLPPPVDALRTLGDLTLGTAAVWGPSAFHSLTLLVAGMALGNAVYAPERRPDARALAAALGLVAVALVGAEMAQHGGRGFFEGITDLSKYRAHNHPVYYAYGLLGAALTIPLAALLDRIAPARLRATLHALGGATFSYFVIGNAVLILIPEHTARSGVEAAALVTSVLALSAALTLAWRRLARRRRAA